jgi:hypothetical protein
MTVHPYSRIFTGKTAAPTVNDDITLNYEVGDEWIDETNNKSYKCLDATDGAAVWIELGGSTVREVLTAARTYYVRTDGADTNTGLADTAGGAFLTIGKALDIVGGLDAATYAVTVQVGAGTWTTALTLPATIGSTAPTLKGDTTTPSNVTISTAGGCIVASGANVRWNIQGFKIASSGGNGIQADNYANIGINGNMEYGTIAVIGIAATKGGVISCNSNYTISGNSIYHLYTQNLGVIIQNSLTATLSGTRAFTVFTVATIMSHIQATSITYSGSATGTRYSADQNSVINTGGGGANYFPGNAAGATGTGGQYV